MTLSQSQEVRHTPGPWRISGAAEGRGYSISAKRGLVALVKDDTHPLADVSEGQAQANARLIAAAPDMYLALKEARLQINYLHGKFSETGSGNAVLSRIESSLNYAEGRNV